MSDRSFPSRPWALSQSLALIVGAFILLTSSRSAGASTPLPAPVAQVARAMKVPESSVSVWVQRIGDAQPRVAVNADTPRNPASVMKLVTSFAALEALGPAYTWKTEFHLAQPLRPDGSTDELWVRGGGDPFLVLEEHWRMLGALRERGLTRIERGLVFDVSAFDLPPEDPGAFDGQPDRIYNVLPHPLLVNFNAVRFRIQARTQGGVEVAAVPALPNLRIDNRLQRGAGACGGFQNGVVFAVRDDARRDNAAARPMVGGGERQRAAER